MSLGIGTKMHMMAMQAQQGYASGVRTADSAAENPSHRSTRILHHAVAQPATAWLLLGLCLMVTGLASYGAWQQIQSRDEARFIARTEVLRNGVLQELDRYTRVLSSARALWSIHPPVVRDEWRSYVEGLALADGFPGLHALGFIERVPSAGLPDFLRELRQDQSRNYNSGEFQVRPQALADEHYVVKYVEPLEANLPALGYDIASDPLRRQAADEARDTGEVTLSRRISLVQAPEAPGVLLLLPVYSAGIQATNVALRRSNLLGWVYAAFVVDDLLARVYRLGGKDVEFQVFDGSSLAPATQLTLVKEPGGPGTRQPRVSMERTIQLMFGNRAWTLRFYAAPAFARTPWFSAPGYVSAAGLGLCISLLVFGIARSLASTRQRAQALADEMTATLRLQQHAMASAKNGLFILDANSDDWPIIYANPAFERMTGYSVREPLGKETLNLLRVRAGQADLPGLRATLQADGGDRAVVREYRRDGSQFWGEFRLVPVLGDNGRRTHFLGIVEDVSERKRAEEQLARAEQRYHELVDNLCVGVYRKTPGEEGRFLESNPALVSMFEAASKAELMSHRVSEFYVDPAQHRELSERIMREGFVKDLELELQTLKGRRFWASVSATRRADEKGRIVFDGVIADITERKLAVESLQRERIFMRTVLDNLPDVIYAKDTACRKTFANRADLEIMGCQTATEALGKTDFDFFSNEAASGFFADDQSVLQTGQPVLGRDEYFVDVHERRRWLLTSKLPLRDESGQIIGLVGIGHDITKRKLAEQALQESQERFALAVQGTNDGIWDWNVTTNAVYFSPRWKNMLGYEEHEVENNFAGWERLVHPEDHDRALAQIQAYFEGQATSYELEHRLRHKDGSYRWILARGVALRDPDGKPVRMAGSHVDLTERKQAEEKLQRANVEMARNTAALKQALAELEASDQELKATQLQLIQAAKLESIGTLAAGVAHEVKNPLQTILMGLAHLARHTPSDDADLALTLSEMREAVKRADRIVRELLQLSAATKPEMKEEDLNAVLEMALSLVHYEVLACKVNVVRQFDTHLPPVCLDRNKMEQVFVNLFLNACQAMPQGGTLTMKTRAERWSKGPWRNERWGGAIEPGDLVVAAEIQDSGSGISQGDLARVFDPFFTTKAAGVGTGLGLPVVKNIVDLHSGIVSLENVAGGGVRVTLVLKVHARSEPSDQAP